MASSASLALFAAGSNLWVVPCSMLIVFSFLEWAQSFCAACHVYGAWYRRYPPGNAEPRRLRPRACAMHRAHRVRVGNPCRRGGLVKSTPTN